MKTKLIIIGSIAAGLYLLSQTEKGSEVIQQISETIDDVFKKWASKRGLDWKLLKAIGLVESDLNPNAVGDDGASIGLMQVGRVVGGSYGFSKFDLYNPDHNVEAGSGFLAEMISKYGLEGGIQAYNLGETKWRAGLRSPTYLSKVLSQYNNLT